MAEGAVKSLWMPITKTVENDDGTVTVRGKASSEAVDFDDQIVDRGLMRKLMPRFVKGWGNVRVNHDGHWPAGKAIDLEWDEDGDPVVTARIIEPDAVRMVREGVLQGFSVNIHQPKIRPDAKARRGRIYDGKELSELSLVDRPSNPEAAIDVIKAADWDNPDGPSVPTGWLSADTSSTVTGNVRDPSAGNSGDFDSMGDPILQPGHVRSNAADISVVTMDDRGAVVQVGQQQYLVPYTVESDGMIHWGDPEPLPHDPRAEPLPPQLAARERASTEKGAEAMGASYAYTPEEAGEKGVWSTEYQNDLPDSAFSYISPGGHRDKEGKTVPRDLRHLPIRDKDGKLDEAHIRDALSRVYQTDIPAKAREESLRKIEHAAKEVGIDVSDQNSAAKVTDIREAAAKAAKEKAHCPECGKMVKCIEKVRSEKAPGGEHAVYKGECGHMVHRFEKGADEGEKTAEEPKAAEEPKTEKPRGEEKGAEGDVKTLPVGTKVSWHYRSAVGHGTIEGIAEKGKTSADTKYRIREHDHHPGEPDIVEHYGRALTVEDSHKEAEEGVKAGLGEKAGEAKGNTTGERPAHTDPSEREEGDLIRRMRKALDEYEAAQRAEVEGKGGESGETKALEKLRHEVGAALKVQRQEATEPESGHRSSDDEREIEKVAQALLKRLGYSSREIRKAAHARRKEGLRDAVKRLSEHVEEIPDDPLEHHRSEKAAFGEGAPKKPGDAPERNDGGPAPADAKGWRERIREDLAEVDELMRDVEESEGELVHEGGTRGRLVREGNPHMPGKKPGASGDLDLRDGDEEGAPIRGSRGIPKGVGMAPPDLQSAIEAAIQKGAALGADAATKAAATAMEALTKRLETVEHMARPANPPVTVAEPPNQYGSPWQAASAEKVARKDIGARLNDLPVTDQMQFLAKMIEQDRRRSAAAR